MTLDRPIGYGEWTHIDGWSEAVLAYIGAAENIAPVSADPENVEQR